MQYGQYLFGRKGHYLLYTETRKLLFLHHLKYPSKGFIIIIIMWKVFSELNTINNSHELLNNLFHDLTLMKRRTPQSSNFDGKQVYFAQ